MQSKLQEVCNEITKDADSLEEKINEELQESFDSAEERILKLVEKLNDREVKENPMNIFTIQAQAQEELLNNHTYEIEHIENAENFVNSYKLKINEVKSDYIIKDRNDIESIINQLREHLDSKHESMTAAQNMLVEICTKKEEMKQTNWIKRSTKN